MNCDKHITQSVNILKHRTKRGFTLIELSIVIVIIGLLVSGVVGGQALIEQSKMRELVSQINQIKLAVDSYKLQHNALPGDHNRASDYWGQAGNCYADVSGSTDTCDGNGNGYLAYIAPGDTSNVEYEAWHFWKHLENSNFIEGTYSGYSDNSACDANNFCAQPNINIPKGPIKGTGWFVTSIATFNPTVERFWMGRANDQIRNILAFINPGNQANNRWYGNSLTPKQQYGIDLKMDDGMPYQGLVVDNSGTCADCSLNCADADSNEFGNTPPGTTTVNANYQLSNGSVACYMFVDLD